MKKIIFLGLVFLLTGFGCTQTNQNIKTYKDAAGGYTFNYPTTNWSMKFEYTEPGGPNNPDDGITQAAFNDKSVVLFHPVKDQADSPQSATQLIADLKFPGSSVIGTKSFSRSGLIEVTTKKKLIEYTWIVMQLPNHSSYLVMEITDMFKQPYPEGFEAGVEMILNTVREL